MDPGLALLLGVSGVYAGGLVGTMAYASAVTQSRIKSNLSIENPNSLCAVLYSDSSIVQKVANTVLPYANGMAVLSNMLTEENIRMDIIRNATRGDLKRVVQDEAYQWIVTVGHRMLVSGSVDELENAIVEGWVAYDGGVMPDEVWEWSEEASRKSGSWYEIGCGSPNSSRPMGLKLMSDQTRCFTNTELLNFLVGVPLPRTSMLERYDPSKHKHKK